MDSDKSFAFGRNWQDYLRGVDDERVSIAEESLAEFTSLESLKGRSFLDIGCGSGLFSLAAYRLGAERIVSFDVDAMSVACCSQLHEAAGKPDNWSIRHGSVLDDSFMTSLGTFDIVYSWGVLHHTGRMWEAIRRSATLVNPGGLYYIALYNKILSRNGSESWIHPFWLKVKRLYNSSPFFGKYVLEPLALSAYLGMVVARGENPVTHVRNYKSHRGMSWRTDATDWLGGYPYEFATVEEVFKFVKLHFSGFVLENIKITSGRGLNWYLFRNATASLL